MEPSYSAKKRDTDDNENSIPPPWWNAGVAAGYSGDFRMKSYEILAHTADIGIKVYGDSPEAIFINAAKGMFEIIAGACQLRPKEQIDIELEAESYPELLRQWLAELLYQYSISSVIFSEFAISKLTSNTIKAIAWGDTAKAQIKAEIKAVTYHELEFRKTASGYEAKVIFDV